MSSVDPRGHRLESTTTIGSVLVGMAGFLILWSGLVIFFALARTRAPLTPSFLSALVVSFGTRVALLFTGIALLLRSALAASAAWVTLMGAAAALLVDLQSLIVNPLSAHGQRAFRIGAAAGTFAILFFIVGLAAGVLIYLRRTPVVAEFEAERRQGTGGQP